MQAIIKIKDKTKFLQLAQTSVLFTSSTRFYLLPITNICANTNYFCLSSFIT